MLSRIAPKAKLYPEEKDWTVRRFVRPQKSFFVDVVTFNVSNDDDDDDDDDDGSNKGGDYFIIKRAFSRAITFSELLGKF